MRNWPLGVVVVTLGALAGCDVPPVGPTSDATQNVQFSRIEGDAVLAGAVRGNLVIFRFDAARPPPPAGTGKPEAFTIITRDELFGGAPAGATGPFTAPYAFSLVPPGSYLLRGFLDAEGAFCPGGACRTSDFNPWYGVTGEPNRGDVGGAAVDALTLAFQTVTIPKDAEGRATAAATGVTFTVQQSAATTVPVDRPTFAVNTATTTQQFVVATSPPCNSGFPTGPRCKPIDVVSAPVYAPGVVDERAPAFLVRFIDNNNDCIADDLNGDGQPDFWPRIFVRKQADVNNPALLTDENDWDHDGVVDTVYPSFITNPPSYQHADGSTDGTPDAVLLAAGIVPDSAALSVLLDGTTGQPKCTRDASGAPVWPVVPVNALKIMVQSVALDVANPASPVLLRGVPPGKYAVTAMQFTGQTWRLPNELQPGVAQAAGLPETASQGWYLDVQ